MVNTCSIDREIREFLEHRIDPFTTFITLEYCRKAIFKEHMIMQGACCGGSSFVRDRYSP